jgi:hypothetical protein
VVRSLSGASRLSVVLASALLGLAPIDAFARECFDYGPTSLIGRLAQQTFPGPPDYEDVTRGDAAQIIWVLLLDEPECVSGDPRGLPQRLVREIELVLEAPQYAQWQPLLGKRVLVLGELARGGPRNQKRVVIIARDIGAVSRRSG